MSYKYLEATSLGAVLLCLLVVLVAATEIGNWLGRRAGARGAPDKDAGSLAAATLGLLALLIGFTYSMALNRYDLRRQVVLEEANAIGSTANFALMLPKADQAVILPALKDYTQLRLRLGSPYDPKALEADVQRCNALQTTLWQRAVAVSAAPKTQAEALAAQRFIASLNEMNNVGEKRLTALRNHVPVVITFMLAGTALVAMGFSGYGAGVSGARRRYANGILTLLIAALIVMMLDLQRPDRGTIEVPNRPLADALAQLPSPVP